MKRVDAAELRERAWALIERDPTEAVPVAERAVRAEASADSYYVLGVALSAAGEADAAIAALEQAIDLDQDHHDARAELALELFDAMSLEDAHHHGTLVLRSDPLNATALWVRGALRERRGDMDGADRDFEAAALADPERFPRFALLPEAEIEAVVKAVIDSLHPSLQRYLSDVPVILEEVPPEEVLFDLDPPGRPTELLGCFTGPTLAERGSGDPWSALPSTISLYRRNLSRVASDPAALREELRITILHEIGHFLGLDEEDLARRGLD